MYTTIRRIHLIGIGGTGMSGIAEVLLNQGYDVSGSDIKHTEVTETLERLGGRVFYSHNARNVQNAQVVVISSAIRADNPELVAAREQNIPVISRAEMLAELMRQKYGIAIAGAHGKTTTTSMIASVLTQGYLAPTIVIGGRLRSSNRNAKLGTGQFFVAEADESDGSFLKLSPTIAVITTIDEEHLDHYKDIEEIKDAFVEFANKIPFYGAAVVCADDEHVRSIIPRITRRVLTYGLDGETDVSALAVTQTGMRVCYKAFLKGELLGEMELNMPGRHNVYNSLAALAVGLELRVEFEAIKSALAEFQGVERRFEMKGEAGGITVLDDYGHHPTEIRAVLETARDIWRRRVVAVFQPHRYTRTALLLSEFGKAFDACERVYLTDIYAAGEEPVEGVSSEHVAVEIRKRGKAEAEYEPDWESLLEELSAFLRPGDIVVTLGAGDITGFGERLLDRIRAGKESVRCE
ncbi:MAG: UDP-N-acetylmuramate--L-alanine ligase [Candidatus Eiseniibacteriota bacterium]|nr:MAG: UDP-N-acetylmuramate--L-alanine ligase [Candidatus Eisenbacteria bacterium]